MQGRIFALMGTLGVGGQSLGILAAGPLAEKVFEPLMAADGALAGSIGGLIGIGDGRGMALMFIILDLITLGVVLVSWLTPSIRLLEDQLPDQEVELNR